MGVTALSKPDFHRVFTFIHPECVTGLTLSDAEITPGQIGLFLSLVDLHRFTQLHSLTLLSLGYQYLCSFLEHAERCSLTSVALHSAFYSSQKDAKIAQYLSSILAQPSLLHLELLTLNLSQLVAQHDWPGQCKLRYIELVRDTEVPVFEMIASSLDLETLVIDDDAGPLSDNLYEREEWSSVPYTRLTFITLTNVYASVDQVLSMLSITPSLRHFKIINTSSDMIDASRREDLIQTKLPALDKFEVYTIFSHFTPKENTGTAIMDEMIAPLCTPFWTEEKRWMVTCNWFPTKRAVEIYTSPICTSSYTHLLDPKVTTISKCERKDQQAIMLESVIELRVKASRVLVGALVSLVRHRS